MWGNGEQIRNWTYVDDIVEGTIRAAENIEDGTAVNLGTMERVRVIDAVKMVCDLAGYEPEIVTQPDKPTGPMNRVADNTLAKSCSTGSPRCCSRRVCAGRSSGTSPTRTPRRSGRSSTSC